MAVSIHAPARDATCPGARCRTSRRCFNPRARAGRDGRGKQMPPHTLLFQSTRPRGARLCGIGLPRQLPSVSIHAPARGATHWRASWPGPIVSIHAPARGATEGLRWPRQTAAVSIHAPARGATMRCCSRLTARSMFQSTRPRGARRADAETTSPGVPMFQSTRPRGARRSSSASGALARGFQSTRPRGARRASATKSCR